MDAVIAVIALVVSAIALGAGIVATKHAGRSAAAAEASAREAVKANELQAQSIKMESEATAAAARRNMPVLIVRLDGRDVDGEIATVQLPVENRGGWCRDVFVICDWDDASVEPPVLPHGASGVAKATTAAWVKGTNPIPFEVRFTDDQGQEHTRDLRPDPRGTTWTSI